MLIFGCGCSSPFIWYQLVVNIINTIFVKRGRPAWKTVVYTEGLLWKKKKKTFNGRELHMYRPLHGLYMKQYYIQFHPFYIANRINNTINGIFCHRLQYGKGTYGTIAYYNSDWKTMQRIHICYVNITIHYTSNY